MAKFKAIKTAKGLAKALDLGASDAVAWGIRYKLTNKIIASFNIADTTVAALAKQSGTSRARITAVLRGDSEGISLEVLLRILGALGQTVKVSFGRTA